MRRGPDRRVRQGSGQQHQPEQGDGRPRDPAPYPARGSCPAPRGHGFTLPGGYRIPAGWTAQTALAFMDGHEIRAQLLSAPWPFAGTADDPVFATRFCRSVNREYADLIGKHPDRFGAFAAVPLDSPEAMLTEIAYPLDELGLGGVLLNFNGLGHYLGRPFYAPVLADLDRRGTPVLVHPTDSPHVDVLGMGRPSSVCEYPFDTARTIVDAICSGVFRRHPGLRLILAHCGALPSMGWRIAETPPWEGDRTTPMSTRDTSPRSGAASTTTRRRRAHPTRVPSPGRPQRAGRLPSAPRPQPETRTGSLSQPKCGPWAAAYAARTWAASKPPMSSWSRITKVTSCLPHLRSAVARFVPAYPAPCGVSRRPGP
ncbi:amidohydrolase [Streptomyces cocklensis]|uniref:amidohydrolase family protein n=1 Tax=Actinacidiphila cocklensis TaxID=887465 RepID=UPI00203ADFC7|nr:amidohydrolase family protein [Actinacidiphila cocklensis]MDD1063246.1 amidohydrolase [Actinacidiphila cocklensis]WSX74413.1 amidohydrolase [Streptomyces sp. NBC_00899]